MKSTGRQLLPLYSMDFVPLPTYDGDLGGYKKDVAQK